MSDGRSFDHLLYGLAVRANRPIPGAGPLPQPRDPDIVVHCGTFPQPSAVSHEIVVRDDDEPSIRFTFGRTASGAFVFDYPDGARFLVTRNEVCFGWREPLTFDDAVTYLLGPIFAFVVRLRGASCMHASAVVIDGEAVLIPGTAGAGKSTLAASLVQRGFDLIAEDVSPCIAPGLIVPSYPAIRLWPRSVELLFGDRDALPPISPSWDKRLFAVGERFARTPLPAAALYFAEAAAGDAPSSIYGVPSHEAAICLIGHTYRGEVLDAEMRRRDFELLGGLASSLPSRAIVVGRGAAELARACDLLIEDFAALRAETRHV